jgi:hypothetical protein
VRAGGQSQAWPAPLHAGRTPPAGPGHRDDYAGMCRPPKQTKFIREQSVPCTSTSTIFDSSQLALESLWHKNV